MSISVVCCEVVGWLERSSVLAKCQVEHKTLNSLVHQGTTSRAAKRTSKECFGTSELYSPHSKLSYIIPKFPGARDLQVYYY